MRANSKELANRWRIVGIGSDPASLRYSDHVDYLVASIVYLGTHEYYWARSPSNLASELSLDENRLREVFTGFPGIYRKSIRTTAGGDHYFALQARYAQKRGGDTKDPEEVSYIAPLDNEKLQMLIMFVSQLADHERTSKRALITNAISAGAAIVAAISAVTVALMKNPIAQ